MKDFQLFFLFFIQTNKSTQINVNVKMKLNSMNTHAIRDQNKLKLIMFFTFVMIVS